MQPSPTVENGPNDHTVESGEKFLKERRKVLHVSSVLGSALSQVRPSLLFTKLIIALISPREHIHWQG